MATDGLMLLQTAIENPQSAGSIAAAIYTLAATVATVATAVAGKYGVNKWQVHRKNGNRNPGEPDPKDCWGRQHPELFTTLAAQTGAMHDVITEKYKGQFLIYQPGVREEIRTMKTEVVTAIDRLTTAVEKNGT